MLAMPAINCVTAQNTEILPIFLAWMFCGNSDVSGKSDKINK